MNQRAPERPPPAPPPTVLQVLPHLGAGGAPRGAVDVARGLAEAGGGALVASAGGPLEAELAAAGARHFRLPLETKNPLAMRRNARALAELAAAHGAAVVHARSRAPAWSAEAAARRLGLPFVTTFHGTYGHRGPLKRAYNAVMARGDRVIAVSEHIARHARRVYGAPAERIRVVHRGVDTARFDPAAVSPGRAAALRAAWRLEGGGPLILLPGRLARWKGQDVLIAALARLGGAARCAIAGDDQGRRRYRAELEAAIARFGLAGRVRLVGPCADMPAAYAVADLAVSASTAPEAFGRVAAEAQAMARPVAATAHGGSLETVADGETGWLAPPGDPGALAAALARALAARDSWPAMGAAGRARVLARFTVEKMVRETLAVYGEVAGGRG